MAHFRPGQIMAITTIKILHQDISSEKSFQVLNPPRHAEVLHLLALNSSPEPASPSSQGPDTIAAPR
jgi:hypothetical protein